MSLRFCLYGHDTRVVGRNANRRCMECARESNRYYRSGVKRPPPPALIFGSPRRYCNSDHDTWKVGRRKNNGFCAQCDREGKRRRRAASANRYPSKSLPNLIEIRLKLGWSQRELARRCGLSHVFIQRLELDKRKAGPDTQKKILAVVATELSKRRRMEEAA